MRQMIITSRKIPITTAATMIVVVLRPRRVFTAADPDCWGAMDGLLETERLIPKVGLAVGV